MILFTQPKSVERAKIKNLNDNSETKSFNNMSALSFVRNKSFMHNNEKNPISLIGSNNLITDSKDCQIDQKKQSQDMPPN